MSEPLLKVENLRQHFKISRSFTVKAVNDVSFEINAGESGSGKIFGVVFTMNYLEQENKDV